MIEGLKPYASSAIKPMKPTSAINIPWLMELPKRWELVRAKGLFTARTERARPADQQLSATQAYGVIPQKEFERRVGRKVVQITQHLDKRAHVEPDDFVISMRSFQGGLERAWARGCIRSSYVVLKPSPKTNVGYFSHLFKSVDYIRALQATGNFIRDGQDLNFNNFSLVDLPLPPLEEQVAIGKCLDHANRKIDRFIRAKRKLIGLLNEQKQAIIHRAVTRGLNPNAPLKPSGIPWLGDIPRHWEVRRLKFLTHIKTGGRDTAHRVDDGEFPFFVRSQTVERINSFSFDGEAVLTAGDGAGVGKVFHYVNGKFDYHQRVYKFSHFRQISGRYFFEFFRSALRFEALDASAKSTVDSLRLPLLQNFPTLIPPREEQVEIIEWIEKESVPLVIAITRTEREISLMQEYRTQLTADIVTGKLDVREAAAKLPEAPVEEIIPVSDADEIEELDEALSET